MNKNSIQLACFALLASAFVLAAILIVGIDRNTQPNQAQAAGQNVVGNGFQVMTARTRGGVGEGEESLFILNTTNGQIMIYTPNVGRNRLELKRVINA